MSKFTDHVAEMQYDINMTEIRSHDDTFVACTMEYKKHLGSIQIHAWYIMDGEVLRMDYEIIYHRNLDANVVMRMMKNAAPLYYEEYLNEQRNDQ